MRTDRVTFFFENRTLEAQAGDTIAKALFDAGVRTLSFSVKYKRPRGVHCARGRCVMCHMEVDGVPGVPTCITPVAEGMRIVREDFRPFFAPFLISVARRIPFPAGFYYRMFTRPAFVSKAFVGSLRKMSGVGRVQPRVVARASRPEPRTGRTPRATYDVIVVGAGLSGLAAALAAAENGGSVLLIDEYARAGGHSLGFHADSRMIAVRNDLVAKTTAHSSIDYFPETTAQAFYEPNLLLIGPGGAVGSGRSNGSDRKTGVTLLHQVRAASFVFATGAYDTIPLFEDNDTPGVFGARAIRLLIDRDRLTPGSHAVVYGTGAPLTDLAAFLDHHGIKISAVVDAATPPSASESTAVDGGRYFYDSRIAGVRGGEWVRRALVARHDANVRTAVACDLLCVAFPGQGAYELAYQAGFRFAMSEGAFPEAKVMLPSARSTQNASGVSFFVTGELAGDSEWQKKIAGGRDAGSRAARSTRPSAKGQP
jgi:sarcosine oxidase subunit alpha